MAQHIGIAACSPPGAALCYELISNEISSIARASTLKIEVSLHAHDFSSYMRYIDADDWEGVSSLMLSSAHKLAAIGAEFVLAPCNTIHQAFDRVAAYSPIPWLHIGAEVASEAQRRGLKRVAVLGTSLLTQGHIYPPKFEAVGIEYRIPGQNDRERLNHFILDEMVHGRFSPEAREYLLELVQQMSDEGCDAAGLCCTELPILLGNVDLPIPVLDSTRVLAKAAVKRVMDSDVHAAVHTATARTVPEAQL